MPSNLMAVVDSFSFHYIISWSDRQRWGEITAAGPRDGQYGVFRASGGIIGGIERMDLI